MQMRLIQRIHRNSEDYALASSSRGPWDNTLEQRSLGIGIHGSKMMEKWECLLDPKTLRYKTEEHSVLAYGFRWFNP